jgi:DNA-binding transcriptional LysR family regulator
MDLQNRIRPDWEDLRLFLEMTRHPTLAEAAIKLNIDPTTLGRRLKRLEQQIGTDLFERGPNGFRPTVTARNLVIHIEEMETASLKAWEVMGGSEDAMNGIVRISTAEGFGSYIIAPALAEFSRHHPKLKIDLVAASGFLSVSKREADMAILLARPTTGRLFVRKLSNYALMLFGARSYLETHAPIKSVEDVKDHPLIGYVDDLIYSPKLRYLDELPFEASPAIRSSSIVGQLQATKAGAGLCVLPCFMADRESDLQRVLPEEISFERSMWLAVHEEIREFARIEAAIRFLTETVAKAQDQLSGRKTSASQLTLPQV